MGGARTGAHIHGESVTAALRDAGETVFAMSAQETPLGDIAPKNNPLRSLIKQIPSVNPGKIADDVRNFFANDTRQKRYEKEIRENTPDVLMARSVAFDRSWIRPARDARLPVILEVNGIYRNSGDAGLPHPMFSVAAEKIEREAFAAADRIIAVSDEVRDLLLSLGADGGKIRVVENGVDVDKFAGAKRDSDLERRLGLEGKTIVGFTGSFQTWHGAADLARLLPDLLRERPDIHLLLIGEGPDRPVVEEIIYSLGVGAAATLTGAVPFEEVQDYVALFDVAVAPYRSKPVFCYSPMKVFEYMAAGRAVVAPAAGQIMRVIDDGATGRLYPADDLPALKSAILELAGDPALRERLGGGAAGIAAREYTWRRTALKIIETGKEIAG